MASAKTATLIFRIEPELKEAVRTAAVNENRSIANMISVMIRDYCGRVGLRFRNCRRRLRRPRAKQHHASANTPMESNDTLMCPSRNQASARQ